MLGGAAPMPASCGQTVRLIHQAHTITLKGKSYRPREHGTSWLPTAQPLASNRPPKPTELSAPRSELRRLRRIRLTRRVCSRSSRRPTGTDW